MVTHADDPCCSEPLSKALRDGELNDSQWWICPECGQEWQAKSSSEGWKNWSPYEYIEVIRRHATR